MVFADEIRKTILKFAEQRGPARAFYASDVARSVDPENWQDLVEQVRFVAGVLVKEGKIVVSERPESPGFPESFQLKKSIG